MKLSIYSALLDILNKSIKEVNWKLNLIKIKLKI